MRAKVERVDEPQTGLLSLTIREDRNKQALVLCTLPGALSVGIVPERPRGRTATPTTSQLRHHLSGTSVTEVAISGRVIVVSLTRGAESYSLVGSARRPLGGWWLADVSGAPIVRSAGASPHELAEGVHLRALDTSSLRAAGGGVLESHRQARGRLAARALGKHRKRTERKRAAIEADLERSQTADSLQEQASLILAHAREIPANASEVEVETWDDPPRTMRLKLDPGKSAPEMADFLFKRAKRMRRGLGVVPKRLRAVEAELAEIAEIGSQLEAGAGDVVEKVLNRFGPQAPRTTTPRSHAKGAATRKPFREFAGSRGIPILVGRNAADNDRLTLRVARPHDLWLHARGVTAAHVVVRLDKGKDCPSETLVDAATLAAHFSDLRGEPMVDVLYTPRRFVRKRKGAPVGSVTLEREKVIAVRVEPKRLERLLGSEHDS